MSLRRQLLATFALQGVGAASVLLATLWLGMALGPEAQGAFSHLKAQIEFLAAFAMFGLPQALFYFLHSGRLQSAAARRWALASALLALPIAAVAGLLWLVPSLWLALALAVGACVWHGQLRTQLLAGPPNAWFNLLTALPQVLVLVGVGWLLAVGRAGQAAWLLLIALAYGVAAAWAWQRLRARPVLLPRPGGERTAGARELLHYGLAAWLTAVLSTAALLGMQQLVALWGGTAALGRFTMAATLVQVLLTPIGYAAPLLLRRWMDEPGGRAARRAAVWMFLLLLALALLAGALSAAWPDVGLGSAYDGVTLLLAVLLAGGAAEAASRLLAVQASAAGLPWVAVRAEAARAAVLLVAALAVWAAGSPPIPLLSLALAWSLAAAAAALVFVQHARLAPSAPAAAAAAAAAGPLRVALLGPANSIHLQRWAHAIVQRGHALCIISQQRCDPALLPAAARIEWLPLRGPFGYVANALVLRRMLRGWGAQLLHAHYASGYGTCAMLSGFRPTLLSVWGSDVYEFPRRGAWQAALLRRNLRSATALAATSHAMAGELRRWVPELRDIAITPFGVDLSRFAPSVAAPREGLTLGIVKTLEPTYGVDLLLRAFHGLLTDPELRAAAPGLRLLIVGDGAQRAELQALARHLGIDEHCHFAGAVPHAQVPQWLRQLDVFVAPSRAESFGVAVIEAGACGLPVAVSDAGGLPEVVVDGLTGLVVPSEDAPALQAALKRLVLDADLRARMGRAGREHVAREYGWEACVDRMMACYAALQAARA